MDTLNSLFGSDCSVVSDYIPPAEQLKEWFFEDRKPTACDHLCFSDCPIRISPDDMALVYRDQRVRKRMNNKVRTYRLAPMEEYVLGERILDELGGIEEAGFSMYEIMYLMCTHVFHCKIPFTTLLDDQLPNWFFTLNPLPEGHPFRLQDFLLVRGMWHVESWEFKCFTQDQYLGKTPLVVSSRGRTPHGFSV